MPRPAICPALPADPQGAAGGDHATAGAYRIGSTMEFAGYDASLNPERLRCWPTARRSIERAQCAAGARVLVWLAPDDARQLAAGRSSAGTGERLPGRRARNARRFNVAGHRPAGGGAHVRPDPAHRSAALRGGAIASQSNGAIRRALTRGSPKFPVGRPTHMLSLQPVGGGSDASSVAVGNCRDEAPRQCKRQAGWGDFLPSLPLLLAAVQASRGAVCGRADLTAGNGPQLAGHCGAGRLLIRRAAQCDS